MKYNLYCRLLIEFGQDFVVYRESVIRIPIHGICVGTTGIRVGTASNPVGTASNPVGTASNPVGT
jgi:hypothetical protein